MTIQSIIEQLIEHFYTHTYFELARHIEKLSFGTLFNPDNLQDRESLDYARAYAMTQEALKYLASKEICKPLDEFGTYWILTTQLNRPLQTVEIDPELAEGMAMMINAKVENPPAIYEMVMPADKKKINGENVYAVYEIAREMMNNYVNLLILEYLGPDGLGMTDDDEEDKG